MYDTILRYIRTGKLPEDLEKNQNDSLRRKSKNFWRRVDFSIFVMKRKVLTCRLVLATGSSHFVGKLRVGKMRCRHSEDKSLLNSSQCGVQQPINKTCSQLFTCALQVVTESQKRQVLEGCHLNELGGGHFGRDKTLAKISERYWLGMVNDMKEFCRTCDKCQRANSYNYLVILLWATSAYMLRLCINPRNVDAICFIHTPNACECTGVIVSMRKSCRYTQCIRTCILYYKSCENLNQVVQVMQSISGTFICSGIALYCGDTVI